MWNCLRFQICVAFCFLNVLVLECHQVYVATTKNESFHYMAASRDSCVHHEGLRKAKWANYWAFSSHGTLFQRLARCFDPMGSMASLAVQNRSSKEGWHAHYTTSHVDPANLTLDWERWMTKTVHQLPQLQHHWSLPLRSEPLPLRIASPSPWALRSVASLSNSFIERLSRPWCMAAGEGFFREVTQQELINLWTADICSFEEGSHLQSWGFVVKALERSSHSFAKNHLPEWLSTQIT